MPRIPLAERSGEVNIDDATKRLANVNHTFAQRSDDESVTFGLAQLEPHDTVESLVARADAALYRRRQ
jgi:hypothetical protein